MAFEFKLPDVGEGIHEGEIVRWLVKEGDEIQEDQPLVEVQTDKAMVEIPSPVKGTVSKLHFSDGDIVEVGSVIITIAADGATSGADPAPAASPPQIDAGEDQAAAAVAQSYRAAGPESASTPAPVATPTAAAATVGAAPSAGRRALATPATRRLARELGVDINQVTGTGPGGRVTDDDVRAFADGGTAAETPAAAAPAAQDGAPRPAFLPPRVEGDTVEERIPLRGIRRVIASRMVQSKFTAPHVTYMDEVDATELVSLRQNAKRLAEERGVKLTYLPFIIKAVVVALREFPYMNASLDDERDEIVIKHYYNIGIATDTEDGLVVPVVKHADKKSIFHIAAEIADLAEKARNRRLAVEDMQDSTFTITNLGSVGGLWFTPIINYPEVAILGTHRIQERPVVKDGEIVARQMLNLAISFDHRLIDGAYAARFLNRVMRYLEQPSMLFMEMI